MLSYRDGILIPYLGFSSGRNQKSTCHLLLPHHFEPRTKSFESEVYGTELKRHPYSQGAVVGLLLLLGNRRSSQCPGPVKWEVAATRADPGHNLGLPDIWTRSHLKMWLWSSGFWIYRSQIGTRPLFAGEDCFAHS